MSRREYIREYMRKRRQESAYRAKEASARRLRYATDWEFREAEKARSKANYRRIT